MIEFYNDSIKGREVYVDAAVMSPRELPQGWIMLGNFSHFLDRKTNTTTLDHLGRAEIKGKRW